jgi:tetratricopeptide (TPR) repeat protein
LGRQSGAQQRPQPLDRARTAKSDYLAAHVHLAAALTEAGEHEEAAASYRRAIALKPDYAQAHYNLGSLVQAQGDFAGALACFERAIEAEPDFASAHWNAAVLSLRLGHFEKGWREYGWRWSANTGIAQRHAKKPLWDGADLAGRTLLLHAEQGFGDTIQFVRYLPSVLARGGRIILETQPALARLPSVPNLPAHAIEVTFMPSLKVLSLRGLLLMTGLLDRVVRISRNASMTRSAENC